MAQIAWLCPDRTCNPNGMEATPATYTTSIAPTPPPTCEHCDTDLVWRPA